MTTQTQLGRSGSAASDQQKPTITQRVPLTVWVCLLPVLIALMAPIANAAPLTISGVGGYTEAGFVANGRWTGQPMANPQSNAYKGFLAVEANYVGLWKITGKNFGASPGTVWLLDAATLKPLSNVSLVVNGWSDTKITVAPKANYDFTYAKKVLILVSRVKNPALVCSDTTSLWNDNLAGLIQTRGFGQCTWLVAKIRKDKGLSIPPRAYATSGLVRDKSYTPQLWDCLNYGGRHVGIITSTPRKTINRDGSVTWQFNVSEMNAWADEKVSAFAASFTLKDVGSTRTVLKDIGSKAGASYLATDYYR